MGYIRCHDRKKLKEVKRLTYLSSIGSRTSKPGFSSASGLSVSTVVLTIAT